VLTPTNGIVCADLLRAAVEKIQNVMTTLTPFDSRRSSRAATRGRALNSFLALMPSSRYSSISS
jgi:hypothetical protein